MKQMKSRNVNQHNDLHILQVQIEDLQMICKIMDSSAAIGNSFIYRSSMHWLHIRPG